MPHRNPNLPEGTDHIVNGAMATDATRAARGPAAASSAGRRRRHWSGHRAEELVEPGHASRAAATLPARRPHGERRRGFADDGKRLRDQRATASANCRGGKTRASDALGGVRGRRGRRVDRRADRRGIWRICPRAADAVSGFAGHAAPHGGRRSRHERPRGRPQEPRHRDRHRRGGRLHPGPARQVRPRRQTAGARALPAGGPGPERGTTAGGTDRTTKSIGDAVRPPGRGRPRLCGGGGSASTRRSRAPHRVARAGAHGRAGAAGPAGPRRCGACSSAWSSAWRPADGTGRLAGLAIAVAVGRRRLFCLRPIGVGGLRGAWRRPRRAGGARAGERPGMSLPRL